MLVPMCSICGYEDPSILMKICSEGASNSSEVKWIHLFCSRLHEEVHTDPTIQNNFVRLVLE